MTTPLMIPLVLIREQVIKISRDTMYMHQPGTEVLLACPLVFTKDVKVKREAAKQVTWRTHTGGAEYEVLMTPEVYKVTLDQE